jgi:formylglycine-generating enzyme required for sulfatase activity
MSVLSSLALPLSQPESQKVFRTTKPSESEWEYACRAGSDTPFHFGETITTNLANYDGTYCYQKEPRSIFRRETTVVENFETANAFGLYDMHGNVWEWCADGWHSNYDGAPIDEKVWSDHLKPKVQRVLRGGCWQCAPGRCRSAHRHGNLQSNRSNCIGFRVAFSSFQIL